MLVQQQHRRTAFPGVPGYRSRQAGIGAVVRSAEEQTEFHVISAFLSGAEGQYAA
jgi:hypothetical protein